MLKSALVPERWASQSKFNRPCQGTIYIHPATERTPEIPYDEFGYCNKDMVQPTSTITQIVEKTPAWVSFLLIGGTIYVIWRYRKKLKKLF
jgi:hypothetical protein